MVERRRIGEVLHLLRTMDREKHRKIMLILEKSKRPLNCTEIQIEYWNKYGVALEQSVISQTLADLRYHTLVQKHVEGKFHYYRLFESRIEIISNAVHALSEVFSDKVDEWGEIVQKWN